MRKLAWLYCVCLFIYRAPLITATEKVPPIAGEYAYTGTGPKGHYEGTAIVYQKDRAVLMQWDGGKLTGFGVIKDNVLAMAFASDGVGVGMFCQIKKDELSCEWPAGDGAIWTEHHVKGGKRKDAN